MQTVSKACVAAAGAYCGLGFNVPVAPTLVAVIAVVMVRVLVWTKTKSMVWNVAVCILAMLAAFATLEGTTLSVFSGFWIGVGYGAVGVGIIEIGRNVVPQAVTERLTAALSVLVTGQGKAVGGEGKNDDPA